MRIIFAVLCLLLMLQPACNNVELGTDEGAESLTTGLYQQDGKLYRNGQLYHGMGVNYFSLFQRVLKDNSDTSYKRHLAELSQAGIPFVRFMACGFWPVDWDLYFQNKELYFALLDDIVRCAEENNIGLIPSLFWHMSTYPDLMGEPMDQMGNPESKTSAFIRSYTAEVVGRYKNSPAIWAWECGNEFNLAVDLPNAAEHRPPVWPTLKTAASRSERDEFTAAIMLTAFQTFADAVRGVDPHRLLITGNSIPRPHAWHNSHERSWKTDTVEQFAEILDRDNPDPYSALSVHVYPRENNKYSGACTNLTDLIKLLKKTSEDIGKPLFIGEFGAPQTLSPDQEKRLFAELIDAIVAHEIPLSAMWVYNLPMQDKDWNVTFENRRAYMLHAVSEANRRLKPSATNSF